MFTARVSSAGEEVNLMFARLQHPEDEGYKRQIKAQSYVCKFCGETMIPRFPIHRRWHFYHKRDNAQCRYKSESEEHRLLKYQLVEDWSRKYKVPLDHFRIEHRLDIGGDGRIADIYLEHGGRLYAFEVQLSPISLEEFQQRSVDYDNAGIKVFWVLLDGEGWHQQHRRWLSLHGFSFISVQFQETVQMEQL